MPVIEEIDDDEIDNQHYSIDDFDSYNPFSKDMPVDPDAPVQLVPTDKALKSASTKSAPQAVPSSARPSYSDDENEAPQRRINPNARMPDHMKKWAIIYPLYLDKSKSIKQGRRVPKSVAVDNPLAVIIGDACESLGYASALEITKTHPKDWSNPGRVRVDLPKGKSKDDLYGDICMFLKLHPATPETAREKMYKQISQFDSLAPLAVPYNMKFNKILPGVSPALSAQKSIASMMDETNLGSMMGL